MRHLVSILLPALLLAQETTPPSLPIPGLTVALHTALGEDPLSRIHMVPAGCWEGLLLATLQAEKPSRGAKGATVEVWDLALVEPPRHEAFRRYLGDFRASLARAMADPPASHHAIELGDFMASDPNNPQRLDLTKVQSLQNRFNRLPPGPARSR